MAGKSTKKERHDAQALAEAVRKSVDEIWLAGLGAFDRAQQEGEEFYSMLVQEGEDVQNRIRQVAGDKASGLAETVTRMAAILEKQASGSLEKLEAMFEDRLTRTLKRVGVPTQGDIDALNAQIVDLQRVVETVANEVGATVNSNVAARSSPRSRSVRTSMKTNGLAGGGSTLTRH